MADMDSILKLVDPKWYSEFMRYARTGEGSLEFLKYLNENENCDKAMDATVVAMVEALKEPICQCVVYPIELSVHPNTDKMMIGQLGPYQVVVGNHYDEGTLGFHIPDGAIVPDNLLEDMWLLGKLAGSNKNRVKAKEMKGVFSNGLFYGSQFFVLENGEKKYINSRAWNPRWNAGDNVAQELGITF